MTPYGMNAEAIAVLANGQSVRRGDRVAFTTSDGERCEGQIRARPDGGLYFWNSDFEIAAYRSAERCGEEPR